MAATLGAFAFVGRMALTNYILQAIVCTLFFYTIGLYGGMGPALDLIPSVVLYSAQIAFCMAQALPLRARWNGHGEA